MAVGHAMQAVEQAILTAAEPSIEERLLVVVVVMMVVVVVIHT